MTTTGRLGAGQDTSTAKFNVAMLDDDELELNEHRGASAGGATIGNVVVHAGGVDKSFVAF